jgi:hypothetical protein
MLTFMLKHSQTIMPLITNAVRPGKRRTDKAGEARKRMAEAECQELKRVTAKLRHPPASLEEYEVQIILREIDKAKRPVGAPALLTGPHRFIAIDFWWLRENRSGSASKKVAKRWGVSVKHVLKYANEHKASALEYVHARQTKRNADADLYPDSAFEDMLKVIAAEFIEQDKTSPTGLDYSVAS